MLLFLDAQFAPFERVRQSLSYLVSPVQSLVSLPRDLVNWSTTLFSERETMLEQNRILSGELDVLQQKMQRLSVLEAENDRLRQLLSASNRLEYETITAELVSVDPDPYSIQVIINRGAQDGVYVGQSVLDAHGLFGLVTRVNSLSSRVVLIADANIAVPVYVNRNGLRSVVVGTGNLTSVELEFVPNTADIVVGDVLMSSGLAQRFPRGYPVAEVIAVENDPGEPFARIRARPLAKLGSSHHLLLVFQELEQ